jgi:hypothetical protein
MDMASFFLRESFRLAIIPFRAFQRLTLPQEQRSALNCIRQSLIEGGHLVIDLFDPRLEHCVPGAPSPMPERRVRDAKTGRIAVQLVVERINDPVKQVFTEQFRLEELDEEGADARIGRDRMDSQVVDAAGDAVSVRTHGF